MTSSRSPPSWPSTQPPLGPCCAWPTPSSPGCSPQPATTAAPTDRCGLTRTATHKMSPSSPPGNEHPVAHAPAGQTRHPSPHQGRWPTDGAWGWCLAKLPMTRQRSVIMAGQHGLAGTPAARRFVVCGITCLVAGLAAAPAQADTTLPPGGHIVATIPDPSTPVSVEAGFGSIWVANGPAGTILRIDPASNTVVATIQAGRPVCCLAFGANAVWAASFATDSVVRIDPAANTVIDVIPVGAATFLGGPNLMAAVPGSVWTDVPNLSALVRIDTATDAVSATIPVRGACGEVAADSEQVWVSGGMPPPV